ncbi:XRE family transcriptional regulator [Hapalosiphon sp. MRB220]|nr:XRE family transcriptional regulator [Hapalosiphon sp. MRB220]
MPVKIKLKQLREDKGLSQNALARQLEMSLANIQKIEYGKAKSIPLDTLEKLCLALDCEVGDLLVIDKSPLSEDEL